MNTDRINDFHLERYVLGELPEEEAQNIRHLAQNNPAVKEALEKIESSNHTILSRYPAAHVKAEILARQEERASKSRIGRSREISFSSPMKRIITISSICTALFLAIVFISLPKSNKIFGPDSNLFGEDFSLVKGIQAVDLKQTQLLVFRKNENDIEILDSGILAEEGDLLQLAYVANEEPFGMIFSIDGRGLITLHFPERMDGSTELELNQRALLPHSIELDDAPDFERFFFITSRNRIDVEDVIQIVEGLTKDPKRLKEAKTKLPLPKGIEQYSVLILKGEGS